MFRTSPLLHELERRARALGFTWAALAAEVGIDRTTLAHIRSGRGRLSLGTLHRIAVWFPTDSAIQRGVWEYLIHDVETVKERVERERLRSAHGAALLGALAPQSQERLLAFVTHFGDYALAGRGLLLVADDTTLLTTALTFLEAECSRRGIAAPRLQANTTPTRSRLPALGAAPLLLVDRAEFASAAAQALVAARARYGKVTVGTVLQDAGAGLPFGSASAFERLTIDAG